MLVNYHRIIEEITEEKKKPTTFTFNSSNTLKHGSGFSLSSKFTYLVLKILF
jgi:hypothetical protein